MSAYHYHALTKHGDTNKGIIEADSERQARQFLRERGMLPIQISTLIKQQSRTKHKISAQDLSLFTRQLATLLGARIPIVDALNGISEQTEKDKIRELIIGVRAKVLEGYSLAQAMSEFSQAFPELYCATINAGEQTGRLDLVLEKLADYTENQQITKQRIQQALLYPSLMIIVSISIISFLLTFVVPKIIEVFTNSGQSLPEMTRLLVMISELIQVYGLYILGVLILILVGFRQSLNNLKIKTAWHKIVLKLPISSYLIKSTNVARYIHTFGILFRAGVNVLETMRVSASLVNNVIIRHAFDIATTSVREGSGISTALKDSNFLNPMAIYLITSGEKSGQIADMMERTASHLDNEVKRLIDTALTLLEPLVILFMGVVVLFIVLATLLPIFTMEQLV